MFPMIIERYVERGVKAIREEKRAKLRFERRTPLGIYTSGRMCTFAVIIILDRLWDVSQSRESLTDVVLMVSRWCGDIAG